MQVIFTTGSACSNWDNTLTPDCWPESWGGGGGGGGGGRDGEEGTKVK